MPIYEFGCECGHTTEKIQAYEASAPTCEKCGKPMKRLVSRGVGAKFVGKGFHVNDYPPGR